MEFFTGTILGAFVAGIVLVMLVPPKYEDWLRSWIINQWKNITNRG
jgi:hypothetical protein